MQLLLCYLKGVYQLKARIIVNKNFVIGEIDKRLYGSFIEHIGRAVYDGIYEPSHKNADESGFRKDIIDFVKELDIPIVRYPGGNFLSAYNWEDGTGDKAKRPKKMELAWKSIETNEVGIDEFQEWAKKANTEILMAVNLGTRGPAEAAACLEYCNAETDTYYADLRRKNGFEKPFGIKTWCLGNEMGGLWQICRKTPDEYGKIAASTAKMMKLVDPKVELVLCGSSHRSMPKFGEWELTALNNAYEFVDYLSIHQYYFSGKDTTEEFLAKSVGMDDYIKSVAAMCDSIKAIKNSDKTINLSFDEWNVMKADLINDQEPWQVAPKLFEHVYNLEDALVVGCMMMTLQNNCDRVKIACLAQLVNVIAPIMTEKGGGVWLQTIFYPFMYASRFGRGKTMRTNICCGTYSTDKRKDVPYLESSVIYNEEKSEVTIFAVNRSLDEDMELDVALESFGDCTIIEHVELYNDDLKVENSSEKQNVEPKNVKISDKIVLKKHSWNMLRFSVDKEEI